ncbi:MAG: hypothetical protein KF787_08705 [Phycisphaeraceae bacterium]|nr:hypothetical protein [Phycisphaerae bacterium]MBX3392715.1 hypothetical protein [Phycisphaeraceae bacterium]
MNDTQAISILVASLAVAFATALPGPVASPRQPPNPSINTDSLATLLAKSIPTRGSVEVIYASDTGAGETMAGFDAATGAWYWYGGSVVAGVDPTGVAFGGDADSVRPADDPAAVSEQHFASYFPFLAVRYFLENIRSVDRVEDRPGPGGGWRLSMVHPDGRRFVPTTAGSEPGIRKPRREFLEIDADGRPVALYMEEGDTRDEFTYAHDIVPPFWAPERYRGRVLVSYHVTERSDPARFSIERARQRAQDLSLRVDKALKAKITSVRYHQAPPSASDASPVPTPTPPQSQPVIQWPLFAAGASVLIIAAFLWWRRRSA